MKFENFVQSFLNTVLINFLIRSKIVNSQLMCDAYSKNEKDAGNNNILYTIAGYRIPSRMYSQKLQQNIPCPCNETQACIRKCCFYDDTFVLGKKKCNRNQPGEESKFDIENMPPIPASTEYVFIHGINCSNEAKPLALFNDYQNGTLISNSTSLTIEEYCVDYMEDENQLMILKCDDSTTEAAPEIFTICSFISIVFLVFTFVSYLIVDDKQSLHRRSLLSYITCLIISNVCTVVLQTFLLAEGKLCIVLAYVMQFSSLAGFFWLNVMCFDLWLTFSSRSCYSKQLSKSNCNMFSVRSLYSWGSAFFISVATMAAESSIIAGNYVKPEFGVDSCWFKTYEAKFWYFYIFIIAILLVNLYLFFATSSIIFEKEKLGKIFEKDGNRCHNKQEKQRFFLYLKLFLIMGINWVMEVFSYLAQSPPNEVNIWFVANVVNNLQGVFIFALFICTKKVLITLNKKLCPGKLYEKEICIRSCSTSTMRSSVRGYLKSSLELKQVKTMENKTTLA